MPIPLRIPKEGETLPLLLLSYPLLLRKINTLLSAFPSFRFAFFKGYYPLFLLLGGKIRGEGEKQETSVRIPSGDKKEH